MSSIGRARHPGPVAVRSKGVPGRLTVEFVNVGGWLTHGDMAMDSCAQFLPVAEHRLIPARVRSVGHQLRKADCHSVCSPACQDQISGGHAGVGVISLCGAPLTAPTIVTPEFREFFRLGRALRVTLDAREGGWFTSLWCMGIRGRRGTRKSCS